MGFGGGGGLLSGRALWGWGGGLLNNHYGVGGGLFSGWAIVLTAEVMGFGGGGGY